MLKNTEIMNGLITFYALYDPFVKFTSLSYTLISQKHIYNLFKSIEILNTKIHKLSSNVNDNSGKVLVLILFDILLTYYTLEGDLLDSLIDFLLYSPLHFYIFVVNAVTQRLEALENLLK